MLRLLASAAAAVCVLAAGCGSRGTVSAAESRAEMETTVAWSTVTVTGGVVNLRSGPGTSYGVLAQVSLGDSLQVTGGHGEWYRVYVPAMSLFAWIYGPLTTGTELP